MNSSILPAKQTTIMSLYDININITKFTQNELTLIINEIMNKYIITPSMKDAGIRLTSNYLRLCEQCNYLSDILADLQHIINLLLSNNNIITNDIIHVAYRYIININNICAIPCNNNTFNGLFIDINDIHNLNKFIKNNKIELSNHVTFYIVYFVLMLNIKYKDKYAMTFIPSDIITYMNDIYDMIMDIKSDDRVNLMNLYGNVTNVSYDFYFIKAIQVYLSCSGLSLYLINTENSINNIINNKRNIINNKHNTGFVKSRDDYVGTENLINISVNKKTTSNKTHNDKNIYTEIDTDENNIQYLSVYGIKTNKLKEVLDLNNVKYDITLSRIEIIKLIYINNLIIECNKK